MIWWICHWQKENKEEMYDKIVFLVSSLSQPRAIRRVESIAALGYEVEVYGYDRVQYNCNKFSVKIPVTILGQMSKGDGYLEKIRTVKRDIGSCRKGTQGAELPLLFIWLLREHLPSSERRSIRIRDFGYSIRISFFW